MPPSVVIVSNRLPISVKKVDGKLEFYPSVGGLATGLASYVNDKRNKWIGWPGIPSDDLSQTEMQHITVELRAHNCYPVFLKQKQLDDYYNGYSNSILWPLFHDLAVRPEALEAHDRYWKAYKAVNNAFAGVVLALSETRSTIWVHDYQLLLLPRLVRSVRPKARIGFFLHIPFPSIKFFKQIESGPQLLHGILGSDLAGFHTKSYGENFLKACSELTNEIVGKGQVIQGAHVTKVTDFPMGIDYDRFTKARDLTAVKSELRNHRRKYKGLKVILTVDRLDPTKGLAERLEAYQEFLKREPAVHGKVVMAMLCVPSRTEIDEYKQLRERVEALVEAINREFGSPTWQPVDYMYTSLPVEAVTALYQVADIAFITPLRDGMNLVAKEYIASRPKRDGVLILSSTAGAAQELKDALLVNPRKRDSLVEALGRAVKMPKRELRGRITAMQEIVATQTVQQWAGNFMRTLQKPVRLRPVGVRTGPRISRRPTGAVDTPDTRRRSVIAASLSRPVTRTLTRERQQDLISLFHAANKPLLLLDYDGVLASFAARPADAAPSKQLLHLLEKVSTHPRGHTVIISGRSSNDLELWLGDLPIDLVAEHGALVRPANRKRWKRLSHVSPAWQEYVEPILEKYAANTPGAFVEAKSYSLVWHYRTASAYYAQKNLVVLRQVLKPIAKAHGLEINTGNKILEVKPADIDKGSAAMQYVEPDTDFIVCIGDDYTDEDMFERLPLSAYTIKVGRGPSAARYRVKGVDDVLALLKRLAK